jgi:hypothetical protein
MTGNLASAVLRGPWNVFFFPGGLNLRLASLLSHLPREGNLAEICPTRVPLGVGRILTK